MKERRIVRLSELKVNLSEFFFFGCNCKQRACRPPPSPPRLHSVIVLSACCCATLLVRLSHFATALNDVCNFVVERRQMKNPSKIEAHTKPAKQQQQLPRYNLHNVAKGNATSNNTHAHVRKGSALQQREGRRGGATNLAHPSIEV